MNPSPKSNLSPAPSPESTADQLIHETFDAAESKIRALGHRLTDTLEKGRELYGKSRDRVQDVAATTDRVIRHKPYQTMAVAAGIGLLLGYLIAGSCRCNRE
jgi:ElaB/YqjD/DUF883 family membrane-anchored ribosome-binding protein